MQYIKIKNCKRQLGRASKPVYICEVVIYEEEIGKSKYVTVGIFDNNKKAEEFLNNSKLTESVNANYSGRFEGRTWYAIDKNVYPRYAEVIKVGNELEHSWDIFEELEQLS